MVWNVWLDCIMTHHKYILAQFFVSLLESCLEQAIFRQLHYYLRPQPVEVNLPLCMTPQKIKPIILLNRSSCCGWSSTHCWWWREHTVALIKSAILGLTQTRKTSSWIFFFSECLPSSRKKSVTKQQKKEQNAPLWRIKRMHDILTIFGAVKQFKLFYPIRRKILRNYLRLIAFLSFNFLQSFNRYLLEYKYIYIYSNLFNTWMQMIQTALQLTLWLWHTSLWRVKLNIFWSLKLYSNSIKSHSSTLSITIKAVIAGVLSRWHHMTFCNHCVVVS